MTLHRACPEHGSIVVGVLTRGSHESIECVNGHVVRSWLIADDRGHVVGKGFVDRPGTLLAGFLDGAPELPQADAPKPSPPHPCRNGHRAWQQKRGDQRWRCGECKRLKAVARRLRRRIPEIAAEAQP